MASKKDVMLPVLWQNMFPQSDLKEHFFCYEFHIVDEDQSGCYS